MGKKYQVASVVIETNQRCNQTTDTTCHYAIKVVRWSLSDEKTKYAKSLWLVHVIRSQGKLLRQIAAHKISQLLQANFWSCFECAVHA